YTLAELKGTGVYATKYADAKVGDKIYRMNYDIHVGAIAGLPGKIIAFFVSLVCASLPVTGFIIWWGKKKRKKTASTQKSSARRATVMVAVSDDGR
ncbi:MAG: PepSY domain-containing protein, partial [Bacteroidetes bacterium]|nr:PepSY domain-containing protein [Bacteroidota bacterium]